MNKRPLISIITPSLNQGAYIRKTTESVLSQKYQNIEYIVMDGGSTDETVKILKSIKKDSRFRWISNKDRGQADAINKGIKLSQGDVLCYLNSDDYLLPGTLARIAAIFARNPRVDWISGDYIIVNDKGERIQRYVIRYKQALRFFHIPLLFTNSFIQPSTFWRRKVSERVGEFDTTLQYTFDYDFWIRLSMISRPVILSDRLSVFRIHKDSKGGKLYRRQFEEEETVLRRYIKNGIMLKLHGIHNRLITSIYDRIK